MFAKTALINLCKKFQLTLLKQAHNSVIFSRKTKNTTKLNAKFYKSIKEISFDYAILEKVKDIIGAKLNVAWSDLGSWRAITHLFKKIKHKYYKKNNTFLKPWGKYFNLHRGDGFSNKRACYKQKFFN